ncbi:unnamed protein product [Ranitomeya imitator]|uniref:AP-3 complex subunit beta C-terminal domain-containing protein n=1 Tax=Ranitomeya imitator TaxID=111125 RepID=A0ABN9MHL8_9NEOB|nr:unnamed protein product [Ranitomeya imitator]
MRPHSNTLSCMLRSKVPAARDRIKSLIINRFVCKKNYILDQLTVMKVIGDQRLTAKGKKTPVRTSKKSASEESSSESESESESSSEEDDEEEDEKEQPQSEPKKKRPSVASKPAVKQSKETKEMSLLDLDDYNSGTGIIRVRVLTWHISVAHVRHPCAARVPTGYHTHHAGDSATVKRCPLHLVLKPPFISSVQQRSPPIGLEPHIHHCNGRHHVTTHTGEAAARRGSSEGAGVNIGLLSAALRLVTRCLPWLPVKTSLNRCHTRRFSDVCGRSSDEIKFWPFCSDQRFSVPSAPLTTSGSIVSSSLVTDLEGLSLTDTSLTPTVISPIFSTGRSFELLHRMTGEGLSMEYMFSRQPFTPDHRMVSVQIKISNNTESEVRSIHTSEPKLLSGMRMQEFQEIESLPPGENATVIMGIDFCDSTQAANFQLCTHTRQFYVSIQPPVGELMLPVFMSENEFKREQGKLTGMNEITERLSVSETYQSDHVIVQRITSAANMNRVPCGADKEYRFAAKTVSSGTLVLVTLTLKDATSALLTINSEKMVIATMLAKDIVQALAQ